MSHEQMSVFDAIEDKEHPKREDELVYALLTVEEQRRTYLMRLKALEQEHFNQQVLATEAEAVGDTQAADACRRAQESICHRINFVRRSLGMEP